MTKHPPHKPQSSTQGNRAAPDGSNRNRAGDQRTGHRSERPAGHGYPPRHKRAAHANPDRVLIFGIHAVEAALRNPVREVVSLRVSDNARQRLEAAIALRGIVPVACEPREIDRLVGSDAVHQGALLETRPLPVPSVRDIAEAARADINAGRPGLVLVLDQVTDPHNVGAVLRSAAVFGASGLIMTARNSPPLDGTLAKAASGGLDHVPVALVPNLARALDQLADAGVWRIGLDGDAQAALEDYRDHDPVALILGAEERGLRRLTQENCDLICRLTTFGSMRSLNVSNAAAIAMHALAIRRRD